MRLQKKLVSIHHMLLFICLGKRADCITILVSIHHMLLFITIAEVTCLNLEGFQYITCYCLSMLSQDIADKIRAFQYITCYCLSAAVEMYTNRLASFQYITCYCLSYMVVFFKRRCKSFNTSHVTVYLYALSGIFDEYMFQYITCYCLSSSFTKS